MTIKHRILLIYRFANYSFVTLNFPPSVIISTIYENMGEFALNTNKFFFHSPSLLDAKYLEIQRNFVEASGACQVLWGFPRNPKELSSPVHSSFSDVDLVQIGKISAGVFFTTFLLNLPSSSSLSTYGARQIQYINTGCMIPFP